VVFNGEAFLGMICVDKGDTKVFTEPATFTFEVKSPCQRSAALLQKGHRYRARIEISSPWADGPHVADLAGVDLSALDASEKMAYLAGTLYRRFWFEPWFRPMLRIGATGLTEFPFGSVDENADLSARSALTMEFDAPKDGELFIFVNDVYTALVPIALLAGQSVHNIDRSWRHTYGNNSGEAKVTLTPLL